MKILLLMIICVVVNQVTGAPDITQVAINNLTSAVQELLAKSALNCPTSGRDSRDSITDLMQLVLTQQLLSQSPDNKRKCNIEEIRDLVNRLMDTLNSQGRLIARLSSRIEHLDTAVRNITGLPEDEDEYTATPLVHSCEEIKTNWPDSPSDHYTIADSNGHAYSSCILSHGRVVWI